ncbi:hypothetical protein AN478_07310 [Thiohalorhabdus denitrificans]|uniref:Uncharacterized protein n=1 Tax=Thiohalorhabdus denitrificans TaxID=381306 RepID=A0A0P9GIY6_9GAMM|nr:hypothetical protein AN478_07310 [Thiohalorhabdus denitrificans]SCY10937.1 hypothetical protein SAMN05661077_1228 [Thiohalorhabdus denitrificans]
MTSFARPEIVRCPSCGRPVRRLRFASINVSGGLFPPAFRKLARGEVSCPRCGAAVDAHTLTPIARLDAPWKEGIWAGIPELWPEGFGEET